MKRILALVFVLTMLMLPAAAEGYAFKVSSPNGAPGIALAVLAVKAPEQYTYVAAEAITAEFASAKADFIIAPINAGAKLYKAGKSAYQLAAVVTWGNLYFASQRENFAPETMNGAKVTLFGENTINAAVALYSLKQNGIEPAEVEYLAGAANTQSLLLTDPNAIVLTAEPALTAASMKNEKITAVALNELYKAASGHDGYAQAGLFVNPAAVQAQPEAVAEFLKEAAAAVALCETDVAAVAEAAVAVGVLPNVKVAQKAIPGCALRFVSAQEARPMVEQTASIDLTQFGDTLPDDGFYYVPAAEK